MAFLSVNKDGTELITPNEPYRDYPAKDSWNDYYDNGEEYVSLEVELPKGTIFKIIGYELNWNDKPVEI